MSLFSIAWRNLMNRRIQTIITILVISIGVALTLAIVILANGVKSGIKIATEPYGMIVGSKGSANQLMFNTIFLIDNPLNNIPYHYYEELKQDERVDVAVPFALGDNYRGFRLVGTTEEFFTLKAKPNDPDYFQIVSGRTFTQPYEAVIGSVVAKETGLKIGDKFISGHGVIAIEGQNHDEHSFTVVGILEKKNVPSDQGIYVSIDSYWVSHGQGILDDHDDELGHEEIQQHEHGEKGVTAALIKPLSYMGLMQLYQEINNGIEAQAVFPGQVLAKVFDMMGSGEMMLKMIGYVVLGISGLTTILSLYSSTIERRRTVSILRAIGVGRTSVFSIVLLESFLIMLIGAIIGLGLSYVLSILLSKLIVMKSSISVVLGFSIEQIWIVLSVSLLGIVAGFVPAINAYRIETAKYLNP